MKLGRGRRDEPDVSLTPLIDVVFNILIFFVVSTTFISEGSMTLTLPEASPPVRAPASEVLELSIDADGQYFLDGKPLVNRQAVTVQRALTLAFEQDRGRPLVIKADAKSPHQSFVTALDAAGQVGIKKISIATIPDEEAP